MPRIRIEWVPVQAYGLGRLGFDHLQLVYQQDGGEALTNQDAWFVMEGVREAAPDGAYLGIEGADGRTTLSVANLAAREALLAKIGTPQYRGSRCLPYNGDEFRAWETMASYARDIDQQDFPYIAYGLPASPTPTVNSSSAIASLIHYSGLDPSRWLPYGLHLSPGTATLLGTSGDDTMQTEPAFDTLLGGLGRDELAGGLASSRVEKLFGGEGADLFHWSGGFNIVHGGQPQLRYEADGTDVMDYSGAGTVTITLNRHSIPHKVPNYVAVFEGGVDHLFSIERIQWNARTDRIMLGDGVDVIEDKLIREPGARPGGRPGGADGDRADLDHPRSADLVARGTRPDRVVGDDGANVLAGHAGDDTLYGAGGDDTLIGGNGSDGYVYMPGNGDDTIVDHGRAADIDELILAGGIQPQDVAVHRPADAPHDLLLTLADGGRILIKNHLGSPFAGIERIVFDHAPAWSRTDLRRLAETAPLAGGTLATLKTVAPAPPVGFAVLDGSVF